MNTNSGTNRNGNGVHHPFTVFSLLEEIDALARSSERNGTSHMHSELTPYDIVNWNGTQKKSRADVMNRIERKQIGVLFMREGKWDARASQLAKTEKLPVANVLLRAIIMMENHYPGGFPPKE